MPDFESMGTFEQYVQALSLVPAADLARAKNVQQELRKLGLARPLEEIVLRLGLLDAEKLGSILADIKQKWQITIARPSILEISEESDRALQEKLVQEGPQRALQILECRELREKAQQLGVSFKMTELLAAKGYHGGPEPAAVSAVPVTAAPSEAPAEPEALDLLPLAPLPAEESLPYGLDRVPLLPKGPPGTPLKARPPASKPLLGAAPRPPAGPPKAAPGAPKPLLGAAKAIAAPSKSPVGTGKRVPGSREPEPAPAPKRPPNPKTTFWIGIGSAGALFLVAIVLIIVKSGASSPPPPEPVAARPETRPLRPSGTPEKPPAAPAPRENAPVEAARRTAPSDAAPAAPERTPEPAPAAPAEKAAEKPAEPAPAAKPGDLPAKPEAAPEDAPAPAKPEAPAAKGDQAKPPAPPPAAKPPAAGKTPPPSGDPAREAREARAQALWDQAEKLEQDGKLAEAQEKLRELRSRYRSTRVYWDHLIEVTDKINELGQKIAAAALLKTAYYKRPHMDSWWSFEFVPPEGWKGVPPQPNLVGEQDNDESFYKGRTYQIARYNAPYLDQLYIVVLKTFACTGLDNLESKVTGELDLHVKGLKEDTKSTLSGKMPYLRKTYSSPGGDRGVAYYYYGDRKGIALVGLWRAGGDGSYASITTISSTGTTTRKTSDHPVSESDFAGALKVFDQCAKTFWIYDAAARAGKRVDLQMGALCSDWSTLRSSKGNYIIDYATRPEFAKRAGEEMEQIQALYKHAIPTQKPIPPCRIKIFDREEDFKDYSHALGAAAYWSPMQEEIVAYRFEGDKLRLDSKEEFTIAEEKNPEDVTFKILYHEGFHQYMHFYMGRARNIYVPSWLNEGMGDYFFGGDWNKARNKFTIGVNDWRIAKIVHAVKKGEHVPLDKIIHYEQMQYYSNPGLCYAEGWAINYFFQMSDVAKKNGYNTLPMRMMQELKSSGNWERATEKVFGGMDLKRMEAEWKEFILSLPVPRTAVGADDTDK